ncbi:MAG: DNA repair protein RecN [Bacteroidota bacterium]
MKILFLNFVVMLRELSVRNYALIDELNIAFPSDITVITGETGAGKSILIGALGLVMGKRADVSVLMNKEKKCIVEAIFHIKKYNLKEFFISNDLDYSDETTIRRELGSDGKSRAFINDTPVNLMVLKSLSDQLIDIHSQHETLMLAEKDFRFKVIDSISDTYSNLSAYREVYQNIKTNEKNLAKLNSDLMLAKRDQDYYRFQLNELVEANLDGADLKNLEEQSLSLENAELIKGNLSSVANAIGGGDKNLLNTVAQLKQLLIQISKYGNEYSEFEKRLSSIFIELRELESDLSLSGEKIEINPIELDKINDKINSLQRLFKKHGVSDIKELLNLKNEISEKIDSTENLEIKIKNIENQIINQKVKAFQIANKISQKRKKQIPELEQKVESLLANLNMQNARFKVELNNLNDLTASGIDEIKFLFSANKGGDFKDLHKVASGGELSRVMLSLKAIIAKSTDLPTILFDEIDTGVSGEVGARIGDILQQMSNNMQVISITHLPQIASRGNHHLLVFKRDYKLKTLSSVKQLSQEERIIEIAKMLSSEKPSNAAIKNAEELLLNASVMNKN